MGNGNNLRKEKKEVDITFGESVDMSTKPRKSVDTMKNKEYPRVRIRIDQKERCEWLLVKHGRRSFNQLLDLFLSCHDICVGICERMGVSLEDVNKVFEYLPETEEDVKIEKMREFIEGIEKHIKDERFIGVLPGFLRMALLEEDAQWLLDALALKGIKAGQNRVEEEEIE